MTLFKVGVGIYVAADEIVLLQSYPTRPARRDKQAAEAAGLYKDATTTGKSRDKLRTLVHLRCGIIIGSPTGPDALANRPALETPVKLSTRRNNLENAQIVSADNGNGKGAATAPIERAQRAPRGQSFDLGAANPNGHPDADDPPPAPTPDAPNPGDGAEGASLFARLLGRTEGPR